MKLTIQTLTVSNSLASYGTGLGSRYLIVKLWPLIAARQAVLFIAVGFVALEKCHFTVKEGHTESHSTSSVTHFGSKT